MPILKPDAMTDPTATEQSPSPAAADLQTIDDKLSKRFIELDPDGYFLIYLDQAQGLICAKHFTNVINDKGLACDPETGQPLPTRGKAVRAHNLLYAGRTAKELCIAIFENQEQGCPISLLDHAAYLGREFVRAEIALVAGLDYIQD